MQSGTRVRARAPGRVNLIGEHTDYNGGLCLPFAVARGVTVGAEEIEGKRIQVHAVDLDERDDFPLTDPERVGGWRAFVRGVVAELSHAGHVPPAARLVIEGNLPRGAGLGSSAAFAAALALAMLALSGELERMDRLSLARLCSRVENEWVGARTGLLDQIASLMCRDGHALRIDVEALDLIHVPLDLGGWTLAVLDSGAPRENAASGYNRRREESARACELLGLGSLRHATTDGAARLPEPLRRRVRHVVEENARVDAAVDALRRADLPALARLLDASHASLRDLYEVSSPELERCVELMRRAGAAGARLIGGGFGGSVLGLFPPDAEPPADAVVVRPGPAAAVTAPNG